MSLNDAVPVPLQHEENLIKYLLRLLGKLPDAIYMDDYKITIADSEYRSI